MFDMLRVWLALRTDRRAVTALEYALVAGVIATAVIAAFGGFGDDLNGVLEKIIKRIDTGTAATSG